MANRFPLIANATADQIQELASGDFLDLSQSGIANSGNITVASGSFYFGNGSQLTGVIAADSGFPITAGTSNLNAPSNGNITATIGGTGVVVWATTGEYVTGLISASGNVTASQFNGSGAGLTSIPGANVTGTVANATYATSAGSAVGTAATVTVNAQPNITSVGTLTSVTSSGLVSTTGNIVGSNIITSGSVLPTANATQDLGSPTLQWAHLYVSGNSIYLGGGALTANAGQLSFSGNAVVTANATGVSSTVGNVAISGNVQGGNILTAGLVSAGANITGGNVLTAGSISATGNITGNYIIGNGSQLTGVTASSVNANNLTGNTLASGVINSSLTNFGLVSSISATGTISCLLYTSPSPRD